MQSIWWQMEVMCAAHQAESLGALLIEAGALGAEERSEKDSQETRLVVYFEESLAGETRQEIEAIAQQFDLPAEALVWSLHRDDGWSTRWKSFFHPLHIGEKLVICPTWENFSPASGQKILWLDPGMAFGTGHHATTRGCLLMLETYLQPNQAILDVGCGSGILSLGALLLGASHAVGVDIDPDAISVAQENAQVNQLTEHCAFSTTPLHLVLGEFPIVVSNIQAHILNPMAADLRAHVQQNGILILSGILGDQSQRVRFIYEQNGFSFLQQRLEEEWVTLAMQAI